MRRTLLMIMAFALLLTQCRKPEVKFPTPTASEGVTVSMTVTAGPGSKTDITTAGGITWSTGDKLYVGYNGEYVGYLTLTSGQNTPTGWFSGNVTLPEGTTGEKTFHFFYLGSTERTLEVGATEATVSFASQEIYNNGGKLVNASKHHVGYGSAKGTVAGSEVTGINVTLVSKVAIAYFSFTKNSEDYTDELTLSGENIYNSMTVGFGGSFSHGATSGDISLTGSHSERYVMLVPTGAAAEQTLTFTGSAESGTGAVPGLQANKFYGKTGAIAVSLTAPTPAHETVNFGAPDLNWSVCNLGATNGATAESWYGDYYAWGATTTWYQAGYAHENPQSHWKEGYSDGYIWAHCPFTNDTYSSSNKKVFTKYVPTGKTDYWAGEGNPDNKLVLESSDDAATAAWGDGWRMPTSAEWKDLYDNNTFEWLEPGESDETYGTGFKAVAAGFLVVKGGKGGVELDPAVYMYLPAAGSYEGTSISSTGSEGIYWSSSLYTEDPYHAFGMYFMDLPPFPPIEVRELYVDPLYHIYRYLGFPIRPVR